MAPSKQYDEGGQLQLMEADRVEEEEECFESIDKCTFAASNPSPLQTLPPPRLRCCIYLLVRVPASRACRRVGVRPAHRCVPGASASKFARFGRNFVLFGDGFGADFA